MPRSARGPGGPWELRDQRHLHAEWRRSALRQLLVSHDGGGSPLSVSISGTGLGAAAPSDPAKSTGASATSGTGSATETLATGTAFSVPAQVRSAPGAFADLSASRVKFGAQGVGTVGLPQNLVVKNSGSVPLRIGTIEIVGSGRNDFAQTNNCGSSLGAGQSCTVRITFKPRRPGARAAFINMVDSTAEGRHEVRLEGIGQGPPAHPEQVRQRSVPPPPDE